MFPSVETWPVRDIKKSNHHQQQVIIRVFPCVSTQPFLHSLFSEPDTARFAVLDETLSEGNPVSTDGARFF